MTQILKSFPFVKTTRLITLPGTKTLGLLQVVGHLDGEPAFIDYQAVPENKDEFSTIGAVMTLDELTANGFTQVFEIEPVVDDAVVLIDKDGGFTLGVVLSVVGDNVVARTAADRLPTQWSKSEVFVVYPVPRAKRAIDEGTLVTILNPMSAFIGRSGVIEGIKDGTTASVRLFGSDRTMLFSSGELGEMVDFVSYDPVDSGLDGSSDPVTDIINEARAVAEGHFGVDFTPSNETVDVEVLAYMGDAELAVGNIFSSEELDLIEQMGELDENFATNMIGVVVGKGRDLPLTELDVMIELEIGSWSKAVGDALEFWALVGQIAQEQGKSVIEAAYAGDTETITAPRTAPFALALAQKAAITVEQAVDVMNGVAPEFVQPDWLKDVAGSGSDAHDDDFDAQAEVEGVLKTILDELLGEGNYTIEGPGEEFKDFTKVLEEMAASPQAFIDQSIPIPATLSQEEIDEALAEYQKGPAILFGKAFGQPAQKVDIDNLLTESLDEFETLAKAGQNDASVIQKSIGELLQVLDTTIGDALEDADIAKEASARAYQGLKQANEVRRQLSHAVNNIGALEDGFEALVDDLEALKSLRSARSAS